MDALTALQTRTAAPRLVEPAPSQAELEQVLKAGLRAPDHGLLRPWRFLVASGEGRQRLGRLLADTLQPATPEEQTKLQNAPLRAPVVIVAVAAITEHPKVPAVEQIASTAAAVQNMSVALHALGYASIWRTGPAAHDARIAPALGMQPQDQVVGYLYVGTATFSERPVPEHALSDFVEYWA